MPSEQAIARVLWAGSLDPSRRYTRRGGEGVDEEHQRGAQRQGNGNQRIFFDIDPAGRYLVSASHSGSAKGTGTGTGKGQVQVHVWDISEEALLSRDGAPPSGSSAAAATAAAAEAEAAGGEGAVPRWKWRAPMCSFSLPSSSGAMSTTEGGTGKETKKRKGKGKGKGTGTVVNSVAFHPYFPMLLVTTGTRSFRTSAEEEEEEGQGDAGMYILDLR